MSGIVELRDQNLQRGGRAQAGSGDAIDDGAWARTDHGRHQQAENYEGCNLRAKGPAPTENNCRKTDDSAVDDRSEAPLRRLCIDAVLQHAISRC